MRNTIQVTISIEDDRVKEVLIAELANIDFDGFEEKENGLEAFIKEENFRADLLKEILLVYKLNYNKAVIKDQNWNALWESNFQPVTIDEFCLIRADFHKPAGNTDYEIIITPKMSFGTGHNATTYLMISEMRNLDFNDKEVADFGTGTGILAILAEKMGSKHICAIDYDDWSINNANENIVKNGCRNISIVKADGFATSKKFDIILANINRNVILANANSLRSGLKSDGILVLSGLLKEDEQDVLNVFKGTGLKHISTLEKKQWISLLLECQ